MEIWFYFHLLNGLVKPVRMKINKTERPGQNDYIKMSINNSEILGIVFSVVYDYDAQIITYRINEL
jgi:uncharacterized protein YeeX (DUF496 family)